MSTASKHDTGDPPASTVHGLVHQDGLLYHSGFGNTFQSEFIAGALPRHRNNPKQVPYGLYTEQLSGTAFTAPRSTNQRTWLYRVLPSVVCNSSTVPLLDSVSQQQRWCGQSPPHQCEPCVNAMRWTPYETGSIQDGDGVSFLDGLQLYTTGGTLEQGVHMYLYGFTPLATPPHQGLSNADGDWLIVPQQGTLRVVTEMGRLVVHPQQIAVIPRGVVFHVEGLGDVDELHRGYILEIMGAHFQLPELGPIGANGLVNTRDVLYPTAWCAPKSDEDTTHTVVVKHQQLLYTRELRHSPYNVVAWHGNYVPFMYDLRHFCAVNSVTYDHMDPSIYTVLTAPRHGLTGTALADFVIFPHRYMATDGNTLRPPWYHRNTPMSEFMGLIHGQYDAKKHGFVPGGASLHNTGVPHGPDQASYEKAVAAPNDTATWFDGGLAFMFETSLCLSVSYASRQWLDHGYAGDAWHAIPDTFAGWEQVTQRHKQEEQGQDRV